MRMVYAKLPVSMMESPKEKIRLKQPHDPRSALSSRAAKTKRMAKEMEQWPLELSILAF